MKLISPILMILLGLIVFSNALFNNFVWDDQLQIVENSFIRSPFYIPLFFVSSIKDIEKEGKFLDFYYKPLLFSAYTILYSAGRGSPFPFHMFQATIHLTNSVLLFYLFKHFMKKYMAFFLTVIFLVHPVNEATVAYIASLQDVLFFLFGMIAVLILKYKPFSELNRLRLVNLFLLFSLLSKETGILFVGICFLWLLLSERKLLVKASIFFAFLLVLYSILRATASNLYLFQIIRSEAMDMSLVERFSLIPKLILFYMREIIIPSEAAKISLVNLTTKMPDGIVIALVLGIVIAIFVLIKSALENKYLSLALFFLSWFLAGLGMHLQIFPLDAVAAKRWLYFPLAGILGLIGVLITRLNLNPKYEKYLLIPLLILIIGLFSIQTYKMNYLWQDEDLLNTQTINLP